MPVRETTIVDVREKIAQLAQLRGANIAEIARIFGVTRPTVYKYRDRYQQGGREGLSDRSRAPLHPHQTPEELVERILEERESWGWGAKKIRRRLQDSDPEIAWPARSTFDAIFRRHGLVEPRRKRPKIRSPFQRPYEATEPGELTTIDFKGEFRLSNGAWCHPLTVADAKSRYLLACRALDSIELGGVWRVFVRLLREYGLPRAVLSDNGPPFGGHGTSRFSTFSVRLMKLDIQPVFIVPGCPQQNGAHERMHRDLKDAACRHAARTRASQQRIFDRFVRTYNQDRPHEALDLDRPAAHYAGSPRPFPAKILPMDYPARFQTRLVDGNGSIKWEGDRIFIAHPLAGERLGFQLTSDHTWSVYFGSFFIGLLNERERRFL